MKVPPTMHDLEVKEKCCSCWGGGRGVITMSRAASPSPFSFFGLLIALWKLEGNRVGPRSHNFLLIYLFIIFGCSGTGEP